MNRALIQRQNAENVLVGHMKMLYQVAIGLAKNNADAEVLVRITAARALEDPTLVEVQHPKGALLTLLRNVFVQQASETGALARIDERAPSSQEPNTPCCFMPGAWRLLPGFPPTKKTTEISDTRLGVFADTGRECIGV